MQLRPDARFTRNGLGIPLQSRPQNTAISLTEALIDAGIAPSIGTVADALDNDLMDSTTRKISPIEFGEQYRHTNLAQLGEVA